MTTLKIICSAALVCCLANTSNAMEPPGGEDPVETLVDFLCSHPLPFDGSPEYVAKGPLYSSLLEQHVNQFGVQKERDAYESFRASRGHFVVDITEVRSLDVLTKFFRTYPPIDGASRSVIQRGPLYSSGACSIVAQYGGLPEIQAFVDLIAEDFGWKAIRETLEMEWNPAKRPEGYFRTHEGEIEAASAIESLWRGILRFKRLDVIEPFVDEYRGLLGDPFFANGVASAYLADREEADYAKSREIIRLLHEKGIDLIDQRKNVEMWKKKHKPSPRGIQIGALENALQAFDDCGITVQTD